MKDANRVVNKKKEHKKSGSRRRGRLDGLTELPVDVVFDVGLRTYLSTILTHPAILDILRSATRRLAHAVTHNEKSPRIPHASASEAYMEGRS